MNIIEEVLSACVSSAKSEPIILHEGSKRYSLHSQLHVMMTMPSGTFKSTILKCIPKNAYIKCQDYSYPSLIGSIGKRGLVKGYIMKAAGKCLPIDEFHSLGDKSMKALLSITEDQMATRTFGYDAGKTEKKSGKMLKYRILDNEIHIDYVRCSVLLSGIFSPHKRRNASIDDFAFSSRFLPVGLKMTWDEIDEVMKGNKDVFKIEYKPYGEAPVFEDWCKFVDVYRIAMEQLPPKIQGFYHENEQFYTRMRLQLARLFGWDSRKNSTIDDWERYMPFVPFFAYSGVSSTLTHNEFFALQLFLTGHTAQDVAESMKVSQPYVSMMFQKLKELGLC